MAAGDTISSMQETLNGTLKSILKRTDGTDEVLACLKRTIPPLPDTARFDRAVTAARSVYSGMSWPMLTKELLEWVVGSCTQRGLGELLEINAGHGLLSVCLRRTSVDGKKIQVRPTDLFSSHDVSPDKTFCRVDKLSSVEAVEKYATPATALLSSWPTPHNSGAFDALVLARGKGVRLFLFIGETTPGLTGCREFHRELEDNWREVSMGWLEQWPNVSDVAVAYVPKDLDDTETPLYSDSETDPESDGDAEAEGDGTAETDGVAKPAEPAEVVEATEAAEAGGDK